MSTSTDLLQPEPVSKQAALLVASLASFLTPFLGSSINVALPSLGREFGMSAILLGWVPTSYLLSVCRVAYSIRPLRRHQRQEADLPGGYYPPHDRVIVVRHSALIRTSPFRPRAAGDQCRHDVRHEHGNPYHCLSCA